MPAMEFRGSKFLHTLIVAALLLLVQLFSFVVCQDNNSSSWTFNIPSVSFISFSPVYSSTQNHHLALEFRTRGHEGLVFSHFLKDLDVDELERINYKLSGELKRGMFVLTFQLMQYRDSLTVGKALNNDKWHKMDLLINSTSGEVTLTIDKETERTYITPYSRPEILSVLDWSKQSSAIYYGGTDPNTLFTDATYPHLIGCMREVNYLNKDGGFVPVPIQIMEGVKQGCSDMCREDNPCHKGGNCINTYTGTICDCFGTEDYQGEFCSILGPTTVTLRGYEWISYTMYEGDENILTEKARFSLEFKTSRGSGVLLYAVGGAPYHSHVTASVHDGIVLVTVAFGEEDIEIEAGIDLNDFRWHNLTIVHYRRSVWVYLDGQEYKKKVKGDKYLLSLDPRIIIGGGENFIQTRGLQVTQNFVGCVKNIYVNEVSVLYAMAEGDPKAQYNGGGSTQPYYSCEEVVNIPISFPDAASNLMLDTTEDMKYGFDIEFDFKTVRSEAILFYVDLMDEDTSIGYNFGYMEVAIRHGQPTLLFVPSSKHAERTQNASIPTNVNTNIWYSLHISFRDSQARLKVDGVSISSTEYEQTLILRSRIMIGYGMGRYKESDGFVGCIRNLKVQETRLDALDLMENKLAVTGLRIDGCNITDYCKGSRMCEHGGVCLSDWEGVTCDCSETAYTGRACHFPKYKRTCDEYYQSGVDRSGVMLIDLDGNGPMAPIYVQCDMGHEVDYEFYGRTIVDHNLQPNSKVRGYLMRDLRKLILYRGMESDQLVQLTGQSGWCRQHIQYDCRSSPIGLGTWTWFKAANGEMVEYLGTSKAGYCSCSLNASCIAEYCNCDNGTATLESDSGFNTQRNQLPLTEIRIKQTNALVENSGANITLGPLVCWGNQDQLPSSAVTLASEAAFLKSHPWKTGPLQISFRTHNEEAIVLYQSGTEWNTNYFLVAVTSASTVKFYFRWGRYKQEIDLTTGEPVNNGQWHHVEIDHDQYNIRCMVDMREKIVAVPDGVPKVNSFSGILYIGGVPADFQVDPVVEDIPGLIGCMRGLVYNNKPQPLSQLIDSSTQDIHQQCMASCWPNPCQNGAECVENWGRYQCKCVNQWAHSGHNCEVDINVDAATFLGFQDSYLVYTVPPGPVDLLDSSITFSFRTYQLSSLLLYIHDEYNNFVQVELLDGRTILAKFNRFRSIISQSKTVEGLSDGSWKQVVIDNTDGYIKVIVDVDDEQLRNSYRKQKLTTYSNRPFSTLETVKPNRPQQKPEPMVHVFVGGVAYNMTLQSLSGCVRGLKIGTKVFKLQHKAKKTDRVVEVCDDGCASQPCQNGGLCLEEFQDSQFQCDCSDSEFAGPTCSTEASGYFLGKTILEYEFDPPEHAIETVTERLELVFQVEAGLKSDMILVFIYSERYFTHDFLIVYLRPDHGVYVSTNQGYAIHGVGKIGSYADGQPHQLVYRRTNREMILTLDEEGIGRVSALPNALDELDTIMVGGILWEQFQAMQDTADYVDYANFTGCISDVTFYPTGDRPFALRPLKDLHDNRTSIGVVTRHGPEISSCRTRLQPPPPTTVRPPVTWGVTERPQLTMPPWSPGDAKTIWTGPQPTLPTVKTTTRKTTPSTTEGGKVLESLDPRKNDQKIMAITLAVVAFLLVVAIVIAVLLVKMRRRQQRAEEKKKTEEAEELEMKQPLNHDEVVQDNHQNQNYLARLDEFSMVSATLGARKTDNMSTFKPPADDGHAYVAVPTSEDPTMYAGQQIYNRKKNRPASSISEVLEEMERQRQTKDVEVDLNDLENMETIPANHLAVGESSVWEDPVRTPLSCPNEDFRQMPIPEDFIYKILPLRTTPAIPEGDDSSTDSSPLSTEAPPSDSISSAENHEDDHDNDADNESEKSELVLPAAGMQQSQEYNGDSGYEAESKPDEEEDETLMNGSFQGETIPHSPDSQTYNGYSEDTSQHSLDSKNLLSDRLSSGGSVSPVGVETKLTNYETPVLADYTSNQHPSRTYEPDQT